MPTYPIPVNRQQRFICAAFLFLLVLFQDCQPPVSVSITDDEAATSSRTTTPAMQRVAIGRREAPALPAAPDALLPRMQHLLSRPPYCTRIFPTATGGWVRFIAQRQFFQAELLDTLCSSAITRRMPVGGPHDPRSFLAWLAQQDNTTAKARIHVLPAAQPPYTPVVYLGKLGLLGGTPQQGEDETSQRPYDVFICHAGEQKSGIAYPVYEELSKYTHIMKGEIFLDERSLPPGEPFPVKIQEALDSASVGVFILSPEFVAKKWTMYELSYFLNRAKAAKTMRLTPPKLIPVFYKLSTADAALSDTWFKKNKRTIKKCGFNQRMYNGETSRKEVRELIKAVAEYSGESLSKSKNETTRTDKLWITRIVKEVLRAGGWELPSPASSGALPTVYGGYRAFGAQAWRAYFGVDVGIEPALPGDIASLLNEEAPFMLGGEESP
ncbi:MAG: toll/interleukin-1 receptor domain-containing protein, partial [Bacteroidota bacterium]